MDSSENFYSLPDLFELLEQLWYQLEILLIVLLEQFKFMLDLVYRCLLQLHYYSNLFFVGPVTESRS